MSKIPYLDKKINDEFVMNPIRFESLPFPVDLVPNILTSTLFIVEKCEDQFFVRHIYNSLVCIPAQVIAIEANLAKNVGDPNSTDEDYQYVDAQINCLLANFLDDEYTLAYTLWSNSFNFLNVFKTNLKMIELPQELQDLYTAANMQRPEYLAYNKRMNETPDVARNMMRVLGTPL